MPSLDRETVVPLVLAVLALFALVFAAATLDSLVVESGTGTGEGSGDQARPPVDRTGDNVSLGYVSNGSSRAGSGGSSLDVSFCIPFLTTPLGTLLFFGAGVLALYGIYRRHGAAALGLFGLGVGPPVGILYLFFTRACGSGSGFQRAAVNGTASSGGAGGGGLQALQVPPVVLIAAFGVVIVGAAVLMLFTTTGDEAVEPPERDEEIAEETDLEEVARVAGEAAERIEEGQADLDNEVYRAWREMTDLLDVARPASSTPGEFATAAIEAGMNRDDVAELTRLFNEVRYGELDPEPREELALETLGNIEAEYGVDEPEEEA